MSRLDLHTHSHYSDGTSSPAEVVRKAKDAGVDVLVLTDHDSVSGCGEARAEGVAQGLRVSCGVEINTCEQDNLHILGYRIDSESPVLRGRLEEFRGRRRLRLRRIVERLREAGLDVAYEDIARISRQSVGRPHVADAMVRKGLARTRKDAFDRWLMRGKPGYVEPMGPTPEEAIAAIRESGGWSSLAHPGEMQDDSLLRRLAGAGLAGVEAYYPTHTQTTVLRLLGWAAGLGLQPTAGSDYHGPKTGRERIGHVDIPPELRERLLELV